MDASSQIANSTALVEGACLPKQPVQIIGTSIHTSNTETVLKQRIRTAHKMRKKKQPIGVYETHIKIQERNCLDRSTGFHFYLTLIHAC